MKRQISFMNGGADEWKRGDVKIDKRKSTALPYGKE